MNEVFAVVDITTFVVALIAASAAILGVVANWRKTQNEAHKVEAQVDQTIVDVHQDIISSLRQHNDWLQMDRAKMGSKLDSLNEEMHPNGGKSLRDAVDRIERTLLDLDKRLSKMELDDRT